MRAQALTFLGLTIKLLDCNRCMRFVRPRLLRRLHYIISVMSARALTGQAGRVLWSKAQRPDQLQFRARGQSQLLALQSLSLQAPATI